jgi:thiamine biosynthesis lipoprotein
MPVVLLARHAMRCRFEMVLHGDDPVRLRAAGEEALDEIDRLESKLSLYRANSEIAAVNNGAASGAVPVSPVTFHLLERAAELSRVTGGAFDITIAPLVRAWGFMGGDGHPAQPEQLASARECIGMRHVELNPGTFAVRFRRRGIMLDLGAIGKGYAVDRAAETLRELGVKAALIHGGTSTVFAFGQPEDAASWKVALESPSEIMGKPGQQLPSLVLHDESLSTSAVWGKHFTAEGRILGHVIDPRTGHPVQAALLATVISPSATDSDALSTAMLTLGPPGLELLAQAVPRLRALVVSVPKAGEPFVVTSRGVDAQLATREG